MMSKAVMSNELVQTRPVAWPWLNWIALLITAPILLFAGAYRPVVAAPALVVLAVPFVVRLLRVGRPFRYTPINWMVILLAVVFIPLSFVMSPLPWSVSWPRAAALLWSFALFFQVVNWADGSDGAGNRRTRMNGTFKVYLLLGGLIGLLGIFGMQDVDKLFNVSLPSLGDVWPALGLALATNEVGGVLTLFVPLAAAIVYSCLATRRTRYFLFVTPLLLVMLAALVLTQSRTALASTAIALLLVLALVGRPNRWWLVGALVLVGAAILLLTRTSLIDRVVYAGANSWSSVINPRLLVWEQGLNALRDFPIWGIGLGTFGRLAPRIYPQSPIEQAKILEDAHNLYLQNALDFGLVGGLLMLVVLLVVAGALIRQVGARPRGSLGRALVVGLLASLLAHLLYSLTDAVALGTTAGAALWFLLGLALQPVSLRQAPERHWPKIALSAGAAVLLIGILVSMNLATNWGATLTTDAIFHPNQYDPVTATNVGRLAQRDCDLRWHEGLLYHWRGEMPKRGEAWNELLSCTTRFTGMMRVLAPTDEALARRAIEAQPQDAAGYFWLAEMSAAASPAEAIELYRQGLWHAPADGLAWQRLADLLVERDKDAALVAYLQSCKNGDPGANGCLRAGGLAEERGDIAAAISYYRLSKFSGALERAAELERGSGEEE